MLDTKEGSTAVLSDITKKITALRLVVARRGEMDCSKWWNTDGVLSGNGKLIFPRGFPKTQVFARARVVFAVAAARSDEVFNQPNSYTLWRLPVEIEDEIEDSWSSWLEAPGEWEALLEKIDESSSSDIAELLNSLGLLSEKTIGRTKSLRRNADLKSVPLKLDGESLSEAIELLAVAHRSSEVGKLAVPFIREEEFPK